MTWTSEKPSVPGFYFMKRLDVKGHPYGMVEVRSFPFKDQVYIEVRVADYWQSLNAFVRDTQCQWAGPLPAPEEG